MNKKIESLLSHFRVTPKSLGMFFVMFSTWWGTMGDKAITVRDVVAFVASFLASTLVPARKDAAE